MSWTGDLVMILQFQSLFHLKKLAVGVLKILDFQLCWYFSYCNWLWFTIEHSSDKVSRKIVWSSNVLGRDFKPQMENLKLQ